MNECSRWIYRAPSLLLQLKVSEYVGANDVLIKTDSLFSGWMQIAICIHAGLQVGLELLAQLEILRIKKS